MLTILVGTEGLERDHDHNSRRHCCQNLIESGTFEVSQVQKLCYPQLHPSATQGTLLSQGRRYVLRSRLCLKHMGGFSYYRGNVDPTLDSLKVSVRRPQRKTQTSQSAPHNEFKSPKIDPNCCYSCVKSSGPFPDHVRFQTPPVSRPPPVSN
jgi:hypothetical protein